MVRNGKQKGSLGKNKAAGLMTILENQVLRNSNQTLLSELETVKKGNDQLREQEKNLTLNVFAAKSREQEHRALMGESVQYDLANTVAKLRRENDAMRREIENLKQSINPNHGDNPENEYAVPLNEYWNSLSLGKGMYDSLFSFQIDTPDVWPDPNIWNVAYAAAPVEYSIPDPEFTNRLTKNVAWEILKPVLSSDQTVYDEIFGTELNMD